MHRLRPVPAVLLLAVAGCATAYTSAARDRAQKDTGCPADQLQATSQGDGRYQVTGCGRTDVYVCQAVEGGGVACLSQERVPVFKP